MLNDYPPEDTSIQDEQLLWKRLHPDQVRYSKRYQRWMATTSAFLDDRDDIPWLTMQRPCADCDDVAELTAGQFRTRWSQRVCTDPSEATADIGIVGEKCIATRWEMVVQATVQTQRDAPSE